MPNYRGKLIRWGMVGCGDVCEVKSGPAYQAVPGFELSAVMARTPGKAKDFAERHGVNKWYECVDALLSDSELDGIYIATPPDSHLALALQVAEAGKICSLEKPMAIHYQQCQQIAQAFEKAQLPLFVAYYRRCLPSFVQLKHIISAGQLGQIRHLSWHYSRPPSARDLADVENWRTDSKIAPGGYFDDIACHGLDVFCFLLGDVQTANGLAVNQQGLYTAFDSISASLLFESGASASCAWNFASALRQDQVIIAGSKGWLEFSIFSDKPAKLHVNGHMRAIEMPKPSPIQLDYVAAMRKHLDGEQQHPSMAVSAAHTSWVMDKILATL